MRTSSLLSMMLLSPIASACIASEVGPVTDEEPVGEVALAITAAKDLISPATCQLQNKRLRSCVISTETFDLPPRDTVVPLRTVIERQANEHCSTPYPLELKLSAPSLDDQVFRYIQDETIILRQAEGEVVESLTVEDSGAWTPYAAFDEKCRISINITANALDVDSRADAEAILAEIDAELAAARDDVSRYEQLLLFSSAYDFMWEVSRSLHTELTTDLMQRLRAEARAVSPLMQDMMMRCMTDGAGTCDQCGDIMGLFPLYEALSGLGGPETWQNPDGTTKSLEDLLGPTEAAVRETIESILDAADPDLHTEYETQLAAATERAVRLEAKLAQATAELEPWLAGE